jgi:hypothetical protein
MPEGRNSASKKVLDEFLNFYVLYFEILFILLFRKFPKTKFMFANFVIDSSGIPPHRASTPSFDGDERLRFPDSEAISPVCKQTLRRGYFYSYSHGIFFFDRAERAAASKNRFSTLRYSPESPKITFYPVRHAGCQEKNFFTSSGTPDFRKKSFSPRPARRIPKQNYKSR